MIFITGPEMARVATVRAAMRKDVPNTETFEKCYAKLFEIALKGENRIDFTIPQEEFENYSDAIEMLREMYYSCYVYEASEDNPQPSVYLGFQ